LVKASGEMNAVGSPRLKATLSPSGSSFGIELPKGSVLSHFQTVVPVWFAIILGVFGLIGVNDVNSCLTSSHRLS